MMKRPLPIYFIAVWCFIALLYQSSSLMHRFESRLPEGQIFKQLAGVEWRGHNFGHLARLSPC